MAVKGKKYQDSAKTLEKGKLYDPSEALSLVCGTAKAKFDETIELHVRLGVDSRHADQQVRGAVVLPNGTGKTIRVLASARTIRWRPPRRQAPTMPDPQSLLRRFRRKTGLNSM